MIIKQLCNSGNKWQRFSYNLLLHKCRCKGVYIRTRAHARGSSHTHIRKFANRSSSVATVPGHEKGAVLPTPLPAHFRCSCLYPKAKEFAFSRINGAAIPPDVTGKDKPVKLAVDNFGDIHGTTPFYGLTTAWRSASYTEQKSPAVGIPGFSP